MIQLLVVLGVFLIALMIPYYGYLCFLLIPFIAGFEGVVISNYINQHVGTSHRATLLSMKNIFGNISIFLLFPLIGYLVDAKSFSFSFFVFGVIILMGFILLHLYSKKLNMKFRERK